MKTLFGVDLKQSSSWPSADVKPSSYNLVHAMPWQCMYALTMCVWTGHIESNVK
jgi:hypothetical protein